MCGNKKIALAIIHGVGSPKENYAAKVKKILLNNFAKELHRRFGMPMDEAKNQLAIEAVYWGNVFENLKKDLAKKVEKGGVYKETITGHLREFMIHNMGDAIAYQPVISSDPNAKSKYNEVHGKLYETIKKLADMPQLEHAPLCVVADSLGSVITSNYFWDLQNPGTLEKINPDLFHELQQDQRSLVKGDTLTLFYTLGSPIALWNLRYDNFGAPIKVDSWVNFYDPFDIIAYPLEPLYGDKGIRIEDININVGNLLSQGTPLSHTGYLDNDRVIRTIVNGLVIIWAKANHLEIPVNYRPDKEAEVKVRRFLLNYAAPVPIYLILIIALIVKIIMNTLIHVTVVCIAKLVKWGKSLLHQVVP
ncbi:chemotaxis protein [Paenibacillus alkalitolerans]|uniref:chemotaxis protein n=1 Tax=Paenibacillus alkalitolerans TaxID=2799335 RepID=UPI0018F3E062|nr:chemotaxis protein [Paenibacillus alkalitolerans]